MSSKNWNEDPTSHRPPVPLLPPIKGHEVEIGSLEHRMIDLLAFAVRELRNGRKLYPARDMISVTYDVNQEPTRFQADLCFKATGVK